MKKYLVFLFLIGLAACKPSVTPFPEVGEPYAITQGPHDHLLASYFGIDSWSPDGRYVAVLETDVNGRLVAEDEAAKIFLVDLEDGNKMIEIGSTYCWNFQEAAMFHWLPGEDGACLWNDRRDGKFVTVIYNWKTKQERLIPYPVSAVSQDGRWAVSINYARLRLTRPDYGYAGQGQEPQRDVVWPDNEGLWPVDLQSGEGKLILSIADAREQMTRIDDPRGLAYFCHTIISKGAKRIFFLARTVENLDAQVAERGHVFNWKTTSFTCNLDGSNLRRCYPDGWAGSHFNWYDDDLIAVTAQWDGEGVWSHTTFKVGEEEKVHHIAPGIMDWDGHCIFSPDGKFMSTDGYWNKAGYRSWVIVRLEDDAIKSIGRFYVPEKYREQYSRCDLHPRWRRDGSQLAFNSVHEGSRQVYLRDVKFSSKAEKKQKSEFEKSFVSITEVVPDAILEIRYFGTYNFVGKRIDGYLEPTALLTKQAAKALKAVSDDVMAQGYRLKIYDAYRPQRAVDHFVRWAADIPDTAMKAYFYPDLDKSVLFDQEYIMAKSGHTRGSTVDLTLFDMSTEKEVDMGGTFDWFGPESHPDFCGNPETGEYNGDNSSSPAGRSITAEQFANRMILRRAMLAHGFKPLDSEWWHFTLASEPYPDTYFDAPVK